MRISDIRKYACAACACLSSICFQLNDIEFVADCGVAFLFWAVILGIDAVNREQKK